MTDDEATQEPRQAPLPPDAVHRALDTVEGYLHVLPNSEEKSETIDLVMELRRRISDELPHLHLRLR